MTTHIPDNDFVLDTVMLHTDGLPDTIPNRCLQPAEDTTPILPLPAAPLKKKKSRRTDLLGPVRATRTRKNTERILAALETGGQGAHRLKPRQTKTADQVTPPIVHLLPAGTDLSTLVIQDGWELYMSLPKGDGFQRDRSASDLGNKRRALMDTVHGLTGNDDLSKAPLTLLAKDPDDLNLALLRGVTARLGYAPDPKKASNLRSDLKSVRAALAGLLELPEVAPRAAKLLRKIQKGRWQKGVRTDQWPTGIRSKFEQMAEAYTNSNYAGQGHRFMTKNRMRPVTLEAMSTRFNPYIGFLVNEEHLGDPTFMDLIDLDRLLRFRAWYFLHVKQGGYSAFRYLCSALAKIALYLQATGRWDSGFALGSKDPDAPWMIFSQEGQKKFEEGDRTQQLATLEKLPLRTPRELMRLAERCRTQPPRTTDGRTPSSRQVFQRLFAAAFFGLGVMMPLRGRNWREMKWGRNLFQDSAGHWHVRFSGDELKNGTPRRKEIRTYALQLPAKAARWIEWWREQLQIFIGHDYEQQCPLVFPMLSTLTDAQGEYRWTEMSRKYFTRCIDDAAIEGLDQRFRPHMIRHCVATAIVASGRIEDAQQAATLLGDTLQTVLKMYFKPDEQKLLDQGYYARLDTMD